MDRANIVRVTAAVLFFVTVFAVFARPVKRSDFWWHLNTGRWIAEHRALPAEDPFTYTISPGQDERQRLILQGFWLSQLVIYKLYAQWGLRGPIVMRALVFALTFLVLWMALKRDGLDGPAALLLMIPALFMSRLFEEIRPQIFTMLGAVLAYYLIERGLMALRGLREGRRAFSPHLAVIPVMTLLLANLHRGFMIVHVIVLVYFVSETIKFLIKRDSLGTKAYMSFVALMGASFLTSLANPSHIYAFTNFFEVWGDVTKSIDEYLPAWTYAQKASVPWFFYGLTGLGAFTAAVMGLSWRKLDIAHVLLFIGFGFEGFMSFRFSIYFILLATLLSGRYVSSLAGNAIRLAGTVAAVIAVISSLVIFPGAYERSFVARGELLSEGLPVKAADFVSVYGLPAPLFNPYEWGAYLSFRLYPEQRVFIDSRTLDVPAHYNYTIAKGGRKDAVFSEYGVKTVVFYPFSLTDFRVPPIIYSLLDDDRWSLVFFDLNSAVFVRRGSAGRLPVLGKELLWNHMENVVKSWRTNPPPGIEPERMLAELRARRVK